MIFLNNFKIAYTYEILKIMIFLIKVTCCQRDFYAMYGDDFINKRIAQKWFSLFQSGKFGIRLSAFLLTYLMRTSWLKKSHTRPLDSEDSKFLCYCFSSISLNGKVQKHDTHIEWEKQTPAFLHCCQATHGYKERALSRYSDTFTIFFWFSPFRLKPFFDHFLTIWGREGGVHSTMMLSLKCALINFSSQNLSSRH